MKSSSDQLKGLYKYNVFEPTIELYLTSIIQNQTYLCTMLDVENKHEYRPINRENRYGIARPPR
jgi:hypothetical protein